VLSEEDIRVFIPVFGNETLIVVDLPIEVDEDIPVTFDVGSSGVFLITTRQTVKTVTMTRKTMMTMIINFFCVSKPFMMVKSILKFG
jgi:hypothetical protein